MKKVIFYILLTAFCFSTMEVALKLGGASLDAVQLTFLRFFIGGAMLLPLGLKEAGDTGYRLNFKDFLWLLLVGIMCIPISMLSYQLGVIRSNAATAAALMCSNPLFTMLISHFFTSEKMNRTKWTAFGISIIALVFLIRPWDLQEGNSVLGTLLMLFAAVSFAVYTVMGRKTVARIGTYFQTSLSFILGALVLLAFLLASGRPVLQGVSDNLGVVLYASVVVTGIGYLAYFLAIKASDAATGSMAFFIKPLLTPIWAILILHEQIEWNTVLGVLLLVSASFLTIRDKFSR